MIIEISKIPLEGGRYEGEEPSEILELGGDPVVRFETPIAYDFFVQKASHELVVQGSLTAGLSVRCSRCAEFSSTRLEDLSFLRAYPAPEGVESVDLTEDIREDILLHLPAFPLCSPTCRGLCPKCGKNLNKGPCGCKPDEGGTGAWSALDGLKLG